MKQVETERITTEEWGVNEGRTREAAKMHYEFNACACLCVFALMYLK